MTQDQAWEIADAYLRCYEDVAASDDGCGRIVVRIFTTDTTHVIRYDVR